MNTLQMLFLLKGNYYKMDLHATFLETNLSSKQYLHVREFEKLRSSLARGKLLQKPGKMQRKLV